MRDKKKLQDSQSIRKVSPMGFRILVRIKKESAKTEAGLYLPDGAKENSQESVLAEVIEVASALDHDLDEEANISGIPLGAEVLIRKDVGIKLPWDDELRIVETNDVLALVEEVSVI